MTAAPSRTDGDELLRRQPSASDCYLPVIGPNGDDEHVIGAGPSCLYSCRSSTILTLLHPYLHYAYHLLGQVHRWSSLYPLSNLFQPTHPYSSDTYPSSIVWSRPAIGSCRSRLAKQVSLPHSLPTCTQSTQWNVQHLLSHTHEPLTYRLRRRWSSSVHKQIDCFDGGLDSFENSLASDLLHSIRPPTALPTPPVPSLP